MKKNHCLIVSFLLEKRKCSNEPVKTRDVADAFGLTIYQARQQLEYLSQFGVVKRGALGKGRPTLWYIS
ncbi:regulator [Escherichia coli]|uniref:FaeA/PapI family transcriptional regulator n=1 Tax=Escherichia TaxID=561 RepID=UPI0015D82F16|nr:MULTISPECIES: FaeA/PapI family transcriptional regulator [Escherichia]EHY3137799.1 regulator [Escherichia coli]EJK6492538.1 regulator [Escherichia coli]MBA7740741.1 regulator [Escherichia marmotae]MBA7955389.1 regulator [Escherichia marmotae]MCI5377130.1 regulator [Escherichia coli]